jgi:HTH-type transcriptional regulator, competence development regulator
MRFGEMIHSLRKSKGFTLRQLAEQVDVGFHYLSKVENQKLDFGDYPSDALICRLAKALDADVNELLLRAKKVPDGIRNRIFERPEVFSALARCDDETLNQLMESVTVSHQSNGSI